MGEEGERDERHDDEQLAAQQAAFWRATEAKDCWEVPLGRDLDVMPWLPRRIAACEPFSGKPVF